MKHVIDGGSLFELRNIITLLSQGFGRENFWLSQCVNELIYLLFSNFFWNLQGIFKNIKILH